MLKVNVKEFQKRLFFYINNLPIQITRRGVVIATMLPAQTEVVTSNNKVVTNSQVIEKKEEVKVVTNNDYEVIYD